MAIRTVFSILFALPLCHNLVAAIPLPDGSTKTMFNMPQNVPGAPSLKGGPDLLGYSPNNKISNANTHISNPQLAPGQSSDANIGAYLDFDGINAPQPIRGTKGGTEPGPRELHQSLF